MFRQKWPRLSVPPNSVVKMVESALAAGNKDEARAAIARVQPELARGVARGVMHKNTAARKLSRLTRRLTALS